MDKKNTALAVWEDEKTIAEVKQIYGAKLNAQEWNIFLAIGKLTGLNPYLREIYAVKYGQKSAQIFVGRDGYRKSAQKHAQYDYHIVEAVHENDEIEMVNNEIAHKKKFAGAGRIVGAYCLCKRKGSSKANYIFVRFAEYYQGAFEFKMVEGKPDYSTAKRKQRRSKYNNQVTDMGLTLWDTKPETMIKKVAEAQGLRMTFQELFAGTYDESEQWQDTPSVKVVENDGTFDKLREMIAQSTDNVGAQKTKNALVDAHNGGKITPDQAKELTKQLGEKLTVNKAEKVFDAKAEPVDKPKEKPVESPKEEKAPINKSENVKAWKEKKPEEWLANKKAVSNPVPDAETKKEEK